MANHPEIYSIAFDAAPLAQIIVDAGGPGLRAALAAKPDVVKVNATEAASVTDFEVTSEAAALSAARRLVELGAGQAIVTRGAAGAVAWDGTDGWVVEPDGDAGPYLVGSGDAFLAGPPGTCRSRWPHRTGAFRPHGWACRSHASAARPAP